MELRFAHVTNIRSANAVVPALLCVCQYQPEVAWTPVVLQALPAGLIAVMPEFICRLIAGQILSVQSRRVHSIEYELIKAGLLQKQFLLFGNISVRGVLIIPHLNIVSRYRV